MVIFLLVIFWGFGTPKYPSETESIEGRLVSASEFEQSIKEGAESKKGEEIKAPEAEKPEVSNEHQKVEVKKEEPPEEVKTPQVEKKTVTEEPKKEEPKRVELKKEEPPSKIKEEKLKNKDAVALETRKEKKKQVAEIPKPTEQPKTKPPKETEKKKETFEDVRSKVLAEMKKARKEENNEEKARQRALGDVKKIIILKNIEKRMAEAGSSEEEGGTKGSDTLNRQSPEARAKLAREFIKGVRDKIKSNWKIPESIPIDGALKAVIDFRIDERGKVSEVKVREPSGNSAFDDFCVKAIYRASPLTPPPPELLEEAKTDGLEVQFTP